MFTKDYESNNLIHTVCHRKSRVHYEEGNIAFFQTMDVL